MILVWILLVVGFVLLIKGADYFVEGSSAVAKILRIPSIVIGLTIVAMGTSAPELAVSVTAALTGNNEIAVGNVIGSNIFNLMVVTGTCGVILPMAVDKGILNGDFIFSILISGVLLAMFAFDMKIGHLDGVILLVLFAYFIIKLVRKALKERTDAQEEEERLSKVKIFLYVVGGIVAIVFGGDIVVDCASQIASSFGLSQNLIGLTIVAMGTSLPELVTSVMAAKKGNVGIAIGNIVGSNIFNILFVIGTTALICNVPFDQKFVIDTIVAIFSGVLLWAGTIRYKELRKNCGIVMLLCYAGYFIYLCK